MVGRWHPPPPPPPPNISQFLARRKVFADAKGKIYQAQPISGPGGELHLRTLPSIAEKLISVYMPIKIICHMAMAIRPLARQGNQEQAAMGAATMLKHIAMVLRSLPCCWQPGHDTMHWAAGVLTPRWSNCTANCQVELCKLTEIPLCLLHYDARPSSMVATIAACCALPCCEEASKPLQ